MFTGIIESTATVMHLEHGGSNITFTLQVPFAKELKTDQSVAHDGCCLTVEAVEGDMYKVTAIDETLRKTALSGWKPGTMVNAERCVKLGDRLDGHLVQGHVDAVGVIESIEDRGGSHFITINYDADFITVPQGSIAVNGISLTVAQSGGRKFSVAIIPYTWEFTNLKFLRPGSRVNLEFDIIGKYLAKFSAGYAGR
ncbi:riboflavin synthase [Cruoricaptor ignavus]|nr:riboflavin synthase [Cruoricaptor ignavus]